jgi:arylsulfatase
MTSLLDDGVGRILSALGETGLDATTHVIFVSDHGEYLGDHGFVGKGFHFDSVLRVPLIWRPAGGRSDAPAPMAFKPGTVQSGVASLVDVAPTILELAGVAELEGLQGVSMAEALAGGEPPRAAALTENDDDLHPVRMRTVTTAEWKLTRYANEAWGELYDRSGDPAETRNLYGVPAYAAVQAELTELLLEELLCSFDSVNGRTQEPAPGTVKWVPRRRSEAG